MTFTYIRVNFNIFKMRNSLLNIFGIAVCALNVVFATGLNAQENSSYFSKELEVFNERDSLTLAGTLRAPDSVGEFPLAIFISGSGPQDRYSTIGRHRPFLRIANKLLEIGVATLYFDDRGTGQSSGSRFTNTMEAEMTDHQLIWDAVPAIVSDSAIQFESVGLIGHSLGGMIAMELSSTNPIDFMVLLATPFEKGTEMMLKQKELIERVSGVPENSIQIGLQSLRPVYSLLLEKQDDPQLDSLLLQTIEEMDTTGFYSSTMKKSLVYQLTQTVMFDILTFDPQQQEYAIDMPTLFVYGSKDLQVPPSHSIKHLNQRMADSVGTIDYVLLSGLNHLLQKSKDGHPLDYYLLDEGISPLALTVITHWLKGVLKKER
jgi:pimeloyl-ACP methyl ester carboxylesterase